MNTVKVKAELIKIISSSDDRILVK